MAAGLPSQVGATLMHRIEEYQVKEKPFYLPVGDEIELFEAAYVQKIPVLLKGPTGCGKTRFLEYMSWYLPRTHRGDAPRGAEESLPLVTIACHEDLTATDLVGRYLLTAEGTIWLDGPLTRAVKRGGICYLDEVVEARKDTIVVIHSLTDYRRLLPVEKQGVILEAHPDFLLVISYNPGYQSTLKDLKHSTRQRFIAIEFNYPPQELEQRIIEHEAGLDAERAAALALLGAKVRNLEERDLFEGPSTRLLIYAGRMMVAGVPARRACEVAIVQAMTDDPGQQMAIREVVSAVFA